MSDKNKITSNENENTKKFKSSCINFIKMLAEEKSDSIRLNYLSGLTKMVQKLSIPPEKTVEIIFKNILFEKTDILKTPNLLIAFISFCRKTHETTFQNYFYELLFKFLGDYDDNSTYFKEYIILLSLELFFDSIKNSGEKDEDFKSREKYFQLMIYTDIKEFKDQFFKMIINEKIKLMDNKIKINFLINFFEIIISKNKYQIGIMLLQIINKEIKKNLPDEMINSILNVENKNGFNSIIKKKKEINDFLTFNQMILENISQEYINNKANETKLDIYLSNLMNILCIKKEFNINILKFIFNYFINYKSSMLTKIFPITIYYLSNYAFTNNQIVLLFNIICKSNNINPLYKWVIYKNPLLFNKALLIQSDFKPSLNGINIIMEEKSKKEKDICINDIIEKSLITSEEISNIYLLIHLTLYDYILKCSFKTNNTSYNMDFNSMNKILEIISSFSTEQINKSFYNDFIQFLIDYLAVLYEFCKVLKNDTNDKIITKSFCLFFQILRKLANSKETQLSLIFPSLLNIMSNSKNIKIDYLEPLIEYMIDIFSRSSRINDKIFKLMKNLLLNKEQKNISYKFFFTDKLIDLVIKANEHKLFEALFSLCTELTKTKDDLNIKLSYYIINKYSKFYSGALSDLLQRYIIEKFDENYLQKDLSIELITDENYYIINTIDNIYLQDKPTNLKDIVHKFFGDDYKRIINIFDNLFAYMNKEENNKDIFKSTIKDNNIMDEYLYMKNLLQEILNYYSFVKKDYDYSYNNIFKENKNLFCIYGTSHYLAHLLTQYLCEKIENEQNVQNEEEKKIENDKLMILFDYIYEKILLNKNIKNLAFKSFMLNSLLSNGTILKYYIIKHTNIVANLEIEKNQSDLSQLEQISASINSKKSLGLLKLIKMNPYHILIMNNLILELFDYESNYIINPQKINPTKYLIIENIYKNKLFDKISDYYSNINYIEENNQVSNQNNKDIQMKINISFSKSFFKFITDLSNIKNLELNQIYFLFCLDNEIFNKYYGSFNDFYDFDYTIIQFYSLIRNKNCKIEFKEKFLDFIKNFIHIESVNSFTLRILSEEKTFNKLINKNVNHSEKEILLFNDIIILLFNNLLQYNSYKVYTEKIILNIINNIFAFTSDLLSLIKNDDEKIFNELNHLGKLINFIYEQFSTENNNLNNNQKEAKLNKKINSNLIKNINKELDKYKTGIVEENTKNQELIKFINSGGNIFKENKQKRINFMDINSIIDNYVNNPEEYPFPIEEFMKKYCDNK